MTRPYIVYDSILEDGTLTASSTATDYDVNDVTDRMTWTRWKSTGPAAVERITLDLGASATATYNAVAITGNNFATSMTGSVSQIDIEHSTDGVSWTSGTTPSGLNPTTFTSRTLLSTITGTITTTARRFHRINFRTAAAAVEVGALMMGTRLDFAQSMAQGFDPSSLQLVSRQARARGGNFVGTIVDHVAQTVKLKFGPAGQHVTWFTDTGLGTWDHFMRTSWAYGKPFWFKWDEGVYPNVSWYCQPPPNAKTATPLISSMYRGWTFDFDVLFEA